MPVSTAITRFETVCLLLFNQTGENVKPVAANGAPYRELFDESYAFDDL